MFEVLPQHGQHGCLEFALSSTIGVSRSHVEEKFAHFLNSLGFFASL